MSSKLPQNQKFNSETVKNTNAFCKKSNTKIVELSLSNEQVIEIWALQRKGKTSSIIEKLEDYGYHSKEAKTIANHFNFEIDTCHSCNYNQLEGAYIDCPKCGAFNYNLNFKPLFDQYFCRNLEYSLDFEQLDREDLKTYWCDKVDLPKDIKSLSKTRIEKERTIKTKAWIGNGIHGEYDMIIKLGDQFISAYKRGLNLLDSIPVRGEKDNWIKIDTVRRKIEIELK